MASAIAYPVPSFGTPSRASSSDVSVSSKKVRRRDVIRPLSMDEPSVVPSEVPSEAPSAVASDEEATLNYDEASAVPSEEAVSAVNPQDSLMEGSSPSSVAHIGDLDANYGRSTNDGSRFRESVLTKESVGSKAMVLHRSQRPPSPNSSRGAYREHREDNGVMVPHYSNYPAVLVGDGAEQGAMVVHSSSRPSEDHSQRPGYSRASSDERRCFMVNVGNSSRGDGTRGGERGDPRGVDPSEVIRDRSLVCRDGPSDPPGESPSNAPVVCLDIVPHNGEGASLGSRGGGNNYRKVKWVDPKTVSGEGDIDYSILKHYEGLASSRYDGVNSTALTEYRPGADPPSTNLTSSKVLFHNPRMRIATISSGYKKANFFVREDLDTRIYFHNLEDAIGYMARRGYSKMRREEEDEWRELLGRAHGVVKRGPKKEKQRYRKGRLVLILKKTISDHDDKADKRKSFKKSSKKKSKPKLLMLENGSATARSESSQTSNSFSKGTSTNDTNNTSRTSLGKSVRGPYKSYSEKFLAEQEEEKRQCMLAIAEGRPLPDAYGNDGGRLLLTDGTTAGTAAGPRVPVDPSEDHQSSQRSGSSFSRRSGESSGYSTKDSATSATEYSSSSRHPKSVKEDFKKSAATLGSNRKGVYGGGVRYFTPDNVEDDESEESAEDEDFEEEEDAYDEVYSDSEEGTYDRSEDSDKNDTIDCDGSDMGSMFGEEEETIDYTKGGVESVDGSASERESDRKRRSSRGRRRDAPKMATIDDGSASSGSR